MRSDERRDTGVLASTALTEFTEMVRDVHKATAARLFGLAGKPGRSIQLVHDGIASIAYGSTRLGVKVLPIAAGYAASGFGDPAADSAHDTRRGRRVLATINAFVGNRMADEQLALAAQMRIRLNSGPLRRFPANLIYDADDSITGRMVLFVHGLCETDLCWSFAAEKRWGDRTVTYGSLLRDQDGWTPLYLNFNTGLHISQNGLELAEKLDELVAHWPVPVTEIALVGHSLGGLVARSAAHQAHDRGMPWVQQLRHIVGLGTPHMGAPLERFANWSTHRLARLPETRPIAQFINQRSVGIKDLRYGSVIEEDWLGYDPDELLTDRCTPASLIPGVAYSVASATLSKNPYGPFSHDLLVQHGSAHGIGKVRSIPFEADRTFHLAGGKHHFDLLSDPTVYEKLRSWLGGADGAGTGGEDTAATRRQNRRERKLRRRRPDADRGEMG